MRIERVEMSEHPGGIEDADGNALAPPGSRLVRCPYCGLAEGHTGLCALSVMQTGRYWVVVAVPVPYKDVEEVRAGAEG